MIAGGTPFGDGYNDGLYGVPAQPGDLEGRERERYLEGHAIGTEDKTAGALEPADLS